MLSNPSSSAQADVDRRARVLQRVRDLNTQLAQVCAEYIHCRYDHNAAFNLVFTTADVTNRDYFHPSISGQAVAAAASYAATFDFKDRKAPVSSAMLANVNGGRIVTLTATDQAGVAGIEFKINSALGWTRYTAPLFVANGSALVYRAVDVNGNIEQAQTLAP